MQEERAGEEALANALRVGEQWANWFR